MRPHPTKPAAERPWRVPIARAEVPETGRHLELAADESARTAIARIAGLNALPRLAAVFDVTRYGPDGLRVTGNVSATVGQTCVVSLEPFENEVDEPVDLVFTPDAALDLNDPRRGDPAEDAPEALINGSVDLGALAVEFLMLGLDPYPRKPDVVFEPPAAGDDGSNHPFAALAALQKGPNEDDD